ncbi:hypothetical protein [Pelagicoccus mobilis]|uniref:Uncharacterized protein n=1 Tax=Pelagicoccus mobilis TaxID=415221 RepID=A0A934VQ14_9BACT|nr:hypothetical protein [Pelagicoccus mobilis]MBK1876098.1 hypothetical protein [Pelagicoccus mobilis]
MFKGTKGVLVTDIDNRVLIPLREDTDITYYGLPNQDEVSKPIGSIRTEWFNACIDNLKTACDFDYAGKMIETLTLGLVAHNAGKELVYDARSGMVTNDPGLIVFWLRITVKVGF